MVEQFRRSSDSGTEAAMLANPAERHEEAYQRIGVRPIAGAVGAEIDGVDIGAGLDDP